MDSSPPHHHEPATLDQLARQTVPKVSEDLQPHERDLDQPGRFSYRKPWERRRRMWMALALAALLIIATLGAVIA